MTIARTVLASLLFFAVHAAGQDARPPVFTCNLKAIGAAERPRYNELTKHIQAAVQGYSELPEGYAFKLTGKQIAFKDAAEWIGMERRCCPFLKFQLSASSTPAEWVLKVTGPAGVKAFLQAGFLPH